jgi:hypothetical protein
MLMCRVDEEIDLRLLERQHAGAVEGLEPGDLSLAQVEWLEWTARAGGAKAWIDAVLAEFGQGTRLEAGIFRGEILLGLIALHNVDRTGGTACPRTPRSLVELVQRRRSRSAHGATGVHLAKPNSSCRGGS